MQDPSLYRKYAEECERRAKKASAADRAVLQWLAKAWIVCAEESEQQINVTNKDDKLKA